MEQFFKVCARVAIGPKMRADTVIPPLPIRVHGLVAHAVSSSFPQVDWTRVTDLVSQRRVLIRAGKAYVPQREELSLVLAEFQSRLTRGLEVSPARMASFSDSSSALTISLTALQMTAKALPRLDEDSRLLPVLEHLSTGFEAGITSDYSFVSNGADGELITAEMVPGLAKQSFPMCMRALQDTLVSSKHLKHEGRQQYNLFLKVSALSDNCHATMTLV